jgi:hypothetical protein
MLLFVASCSCSEFSEHMFIWLANKSAAAAKSANSSSGDLVTTFPKAYLNQ